MALTENEKTVISNIKTILYGSSLLVYQQSAAAIEGALEVIADDADPTVTQIRISDVAPVAPGYIVAVGNYVILRQDAFLFDVMKRLESFGHTIQSNDGWMIAFAIQKTENHIKSVCNIIFVPDELMTKMVDTVCGEFLYNLQQTGKLDATFNADASLKQVKVGDATVELGGTGSTQSLDLLIKTLMNSGEGDLLCYRKIKW